MEAPKLDNLNKDPSLLYKPLCFAKKALFFILGGKKKEIENETTSLKYKKMSKKDILEEIKIKKNKLIKKIGENLSKVDLDGEKERFILKTISTKESLEKLVRSFNNQRKNINIKYIDNLITEQEEKIYNLKKQKQKLEKEIEKIVSMKKIAKSNKCSIPKKDYEEIKDGMKSVNQDNKDIIEERKLLIKSSFKTFNINNKILSDLKEIRKDLHDKYIKLKKEIKEEKKELHELSKLKKEIETFLIFEFKYIMYIYQERKNMFPIINTFQKNKVSDYVACNKYSFQKLKYVNHILETIIYCKNKDIYNFIKSLSKFI